MQYITDGNCYCQCYNNDHHDHDHNLHHHDHHHYCQFLFNWPIFAGDYSMLGRVPSMLLKKNFRDC